MVPYLKNYQATGQGRLLRKTTGVWFARTEEQRDLRLTDPTTDEKLLTMRKSTKLAYAQRLAQHQKHSAPMQKLHAYALLEKRNGA